jgi:hypothetical protein
MKVKIRYTGNELVNILAINTIFNVWKRWLKNVSSVIL